MRFKSDQIRSVRRRFRGLNVREIGALAGAPAEYVSRVAWLDRNRERSNREKADHEARRLAAGRMPSGPQVNPNAEDIVAAFHAGLSYQQIADKVGVGKGVVSGILRRRGRKRGTAA